jgi:pyruvate/2-oxoglutarate dehydrogenase complex dihydrolipoamide dehydrogenase (E3) component
MGEPEHTDVVVIGMGPGGEYAAGALAEAGLHVTAVEERLVGGECPYFGCVPSKMMIRAGNLITEARRVPGMAGSATVTPDWSPVALRIREEATDYWDDKVAADRFIGKGGHLVRGHGTITGPGEVTVSAASGGPRVLRARKGIVINSGTAPAVPPIVGLAGTPYWTNREIVQAEQVPGSMIVLGGGAIGAELAQAGVVRGTRGQCADRAGLRRRGDQGVHRRPGRAGQPQRHPVQRAPGPEHPDGRAAAGRHRPAGGPGRARGGRGGLG